ncbi:MAG TPA: hypothetical protein VES93_09265 [Ornithinibacter sp.]|nr:hypothetical protein [Ornithinibacter sp.]
MTPASWTATLRRRVPPAVLVGHVVVPAVVAILVLGPALGRGVVLAYDLAWSPDPRLTPFTLGTSTPAPRAVPSDAAGVVLGWLLGAGVAQALVLWGALVLAGAGAARLTAVLAPGAGWAPRSAAAVAAIWNPFVLERLVVGQWTVLLGYAAVPHLLVACLRVRSGRAPVWAPAVGLAACGIGGANTLVVGALAVAGILLAPRPRWAALGLAGLSALGVSAVWALPAVTAGVASAPVGVAAFAARADTPLGVFGSLLSGGAFWNPASHPASRDVLVVALTATVLAVVAVVVAARAARREGVGALLVPAVAGLLLAELSALDPFGLWTALVVHVPGGGLLRDAQKLVAPWVVLAAAGAGVLVRDLLRVRSAGPALAVLVAALPVALLPTLAWGVGGRVTAVAVPEDLRTAASMLSARPTGSVGLLPWSQYRRYGWNGDRVSLTLVPRMVDQRVVLDDGLPLADGVVPGEDPVARAVTARIAAGATPVQALAEQGVRWVVVEKDTGFPDPVPASDLPASARVVHDGPAVRVLELAGGAADPPARTATIWGWAVTAVTWLAALGCVVSRTARARRTDW